jgi:Mce-associated membrane protein
MTMLGRRRRGKAAEQVADTETEIGEDTVEAAEADGTDEDQADDTRSEAEPTKAARRSVRMVKATRAETAGSGQPEGPAGSRSGPVLVLGLLTVVALALAAAVVLLWSWKSDLRAKEDAAQNGLNAATSAAQDFSSYDYRTLDSNFKTSSDAATGTFRQQYLSMMSQVRQAAVQQQIVVVGTVLKAGVEQVGAHQMVAVVFLNQDTSRLNQPRGTDQYRLRLTMDKIKGRWLVSKVDAL